MAEWREFTLGELVHNHNSARRPVKANDRIPGDTPYYGASGIVDSVEGFTHEGEFLLVSEDGENLKSRSTPIAFTASGRIWVNNHAHVLTGREAHDTHFLQYALSATDISGYLTGSAQPKLSKAAMESIRLRLPDSATRRAIAEVLGALDDKMAVNERQAVLIADLADSAFVATRRHAGRSFKLADLVDTQYGVTTSATRGTGPRLIRVTDINKKPWIEWDTAPSCQLDETDLTKYRLSGGDIVVARMADPGKVALIDDGDPDAVFASYLVRLRARSTEHAVYIYYFLRSAEYQLYAHGSSSGSVQRNMNAKVIVDTSVNLPPDSYLLEFNARISAYRKFLSEILRESNVLKRTRDELLPLLMSGKVHVREAEKVVEGVV